MSTVMTLPPMARPTAHERFKRHSSAVTGEALVLATVIHFVVLMWFPAVRAPDVSYGIAELSMVDLPPEVDIPPPPQSIARPAAPVISASADVAEDITIALTTFEAQPSAALPPPPPASAGDEKDLAAAPVFTPYTVSPVLRNRSEVSDELARRYPPLLRDAGIGGTSVLWFFIDEEGRVVRTQVHRSSGRPELDEAAARVADVMRFSPAMNRDHKVPVWVQLPIAFSVK